METLISIYILGFLTTPFIIKYKLKETWAGMCDIKAVPYILFLSAVWVIGIPVVLFTED